MPSVSAVKNIFKKKHELYRNRDRLAKRYLKGQGIEIGPLNAPVVLPPKAKVIYVDKVSQAVLKEKFPELDFVSRVDVLDEADKLTSFDDETLDFIIANHVLEHSPDPMGTILNFFRKLKIGGLLYIAIPDKRFTFDKERELTSYEHLVQDHQFGGLNSFEEHFLDFYKVAKGIDNPKELKRLAALPVDQKWDVHCHVWTQIEMMEMLVGIARDEELSFDVLAMEKNHIEVDFILQKNG